MTSFLITGGTGFLGGNLARGLLALGSNVHILTRNKSLINTNSPNSLLKFIPISDSIDVSFWRSNVEYSAVIHCATNYALDQKNISTTLRPNLILPLQLMKWAEINGVRRFYNIDSFFTRAYPYHSHLSAYALSKKQVVEWGKLNAELGNFQFINICLFHLYGPGDSAHKFVPWLLKRLVNNESVDLSTGQAHRDFIHVSDAIDAILCLIKSHLSESRVCVDVASGEAVSIKDFVLLCKKIAQSKSEIKFGVIPDRVGESYLPAADITKIRAYGWSPKVSLMSGVADCIERIKR
jgi:nucleoside-diphosphate-sugar epimerase